MTPKWALKAQTPQAGEAMQQERNGGVIWGMEVLSFIICVVIEHH